MDKLNCSQGFAFSIDALLAVFVLLFAVSAIYFFSSDTRTDVYSHTVMKKQADDLLLVLDKDGELATLNSTLLNNSINSTILSSLDWNLNIDYYNYSGGFIPAGNLSTGSNYSSVPNVVIGTRTFLVFQNNRVKHYGVARLRLWPK